MHPETPAPTPRNRIVAKPYLYFDPDATMTDPTPATDPATATTDPATGPATTSPATATDPVTATATEPATATDLAAGLRSVGYLPGNSTALVAFLATKLGKPVLVEGPAGVGKTELAKALAKYLNRTLVRLQCYEGLDEAKALYEWNYRKQLLRIQTEADSTGWQDVQDDIFGEEFLLPRPLLTAIASPEPVVLLIDEIDKTDQEFEAMLLELLSTSRSPSPSLAGSRLRPGRSSS